MKQDKELYHNPRRKKYSGHRFAEACAFCDGAMENKFHIMHTRYWMMLQTNTLLLITLFSLFL
jgi:hypothetical protein